MIMSIPNDWNDATPAGQWNLDEERERASVKFTVGNDTIWWNGSLKSDKSVEFCRKQLKKLGWNGDQNSRDLSTAQVRIKVEEETHNGTTRQVVKAISAGGESKAPKDPVKARGLAAKLAGKAAPTSGGGDDFDDREIPF